MWLLGAQSSSGSRAAAAKDASAPPAIRAKLEEFCELFSGSVAELAPGLAASIGQIESRRLDDLLAGTLKAGLIVHARMEGPFNNMAVCLSRGCIARWINAALGGADEAVRGATGGFTALERQMSLLLVELMLKVLTQALSDLPGAGRIGIDAEASWAVASRALREAPALLSVEILLGPPENGDLLVIVFPPNAAEWLTSRLANVDSRARAKAVDDVWSEELAKRLAGSVVLVSAVIDAGTIDLGEVASWKPGKMLRVEATSISLVKLESADMGLYLCELGKRGSQLVLRVESEVAEEPNVFAGCLTTEDAYATAQSQPVT